ncbi:MAG: hypothetical protein GY781_08645 [Gammaproteobacteria bacterium]|nr:hypothetical protein [Gammaproteobacteria bacterium]
MKRLSLIPLLAILFSVGCTSSQQVLNQYMNSQDQQRKQNQIQNKYYEEQEQKRWKQEQYQLEQDQHQWEQEKERYLKYGF